MSLTGSYRIVVESLGPGGRRRLALLALLTIGGAIAEIAALLSLGALVREWFETEKPVPPGSTVILFLLAIVGAGLLRFLLLRTTQHLAFETGHRLVVAAQRRLLARDWSTHAAARVSGAPAAVDQVEQLIHGLLLPLLQGGTGVVLGAAILAALVATSPLLALATSAGFLILFGAAAYLTRPILQRAGEQIADSFEDRATVLADQHGAFREIVVSGARTVAAERFRRVDHRFAKARAELSVALGAPRLLVETIGLLLLGGLAWWLAGRTGGLATALPTLVVFALGAQRLLPLANSIAQAASSLVGHRPSLVRLSDLLAQPDLREGTPPSPLPLNREVHLDRVTFRYPGREKAAVQKIDLSIRRGECVALTGPNGSGKSTTADLVMGLLRPCEGSLMVDGKIVSEQDLPAWLRNVAHVPQAPYLLDATFAENVAFMDDENDPDRIADAMERAGLSALVDAMPDGLLTRVGHRGLLLSGGQRQRLAIARALYSPAPLIILDEATSHLDRTGHEWLRDVLARLKIGNSAVLLITHSDRLLGLADRVVRLRDGRIAGEA